MVKLEKAKRVNVTRLLASRYGGKWKYNHASRSWICNDNKRRVSVVTMCGCDDDFCNAPSTYFLYGSGIPHEVRF